MLSFLSLFFSITTVLATNRTVYENARATPEHDGCMKFDEEVFPLSFAWWLGQVDCAGIFPAPVIFAENSLICVQYIAQDEHALSAVLSINLTTHDINWELYGTIHQHYSITYTNNRISTLDTTNNGYLMMDYNTGKVLNEYSLKDITNLTQILFGSMTGDIDQNLVYISWASMRYYGVIVINGTIGNVTNYKNIPIDNENNELYPQQPTICKSLLIYFDQNKHLIAFDPFSLDIIWQKEFTFIGNNSDAPPPLCIDDKVILVNYPYVTGNDSNWVLHDITNGNILNSFYWPGYGNWDNMPVVNVDENILISMISDSTVSDSFGDQKQYIRSYDITDMLSWKELWSIETENGYQSLIIVNDYVVLGAPLKGMISAYDIYNGSNIWNYTATNGYQSLDIIPGLYQNEPTLIAYCPYNIQETDILVFYKH